jgi:hypothetical protein
MPTPALDDASLAAHRRRSRRTHCSWVPMTRLRELIELLLVCIAPLGPLLGDHKYVLLPKSL